MNAGMNQLIKDIMAVPSVEWGRKNISNIKKNQELGSPLLKNLNSAGLRA
jgi:hypothetical protein